LIRLLNSLAETNRRKMAQTGLASRPPKLILMV
jgi:hypothetical protein